ncbi:hypothetical protein AYI68_g102 [Smittium mucronatum]|uniref:Xylanolytic transcriptional activator regulatory domain-containing protein n=1 Tax=Smittium mucronatum TaxID=133383 RepID=A0A1R0H9D2_9FUNG|nr:hypothetical protein AYI68_g102 [Smittium mucronatum]
MNKMDSTKKQYGSMEEWREDEFKRRVWWFIYNLGILYNSCYGNSNTIQDEDISVNLPSYDSSYGRSDDDKKDEIDEINSSILSRTRRKDDIVWLVIKGYIEYGRVCKFVNKMKVSMHKDPEYIKIYFDICSKRLDVYESTIRSHFTDMELNEGPICTSNSIDNESTYRKYNDFFYVSLICYSARLILNQSRISVYSLDPTHLLNIKNSKSICLDMALHISKLVRFSAAHFSVTHINLMVLHSTSCSLNVLMSCIRLTDHPKYELIKEAYLYLKQSFRTFGKVFTISDEYEKSFRVNLRVYAKSVSENKKYLKMFPELSISRLTKKDTNLWLSRTGTSTLCYMCCSIRGDSPKYKYQFIFNWSNAGVLLTRKANIFNETQFIDSLRTSAANPFENANLNQDKFTVSNKTPIIMYPEVGFNSGETRTPNLSQTLPSQASSVSGYESDLQFFKKINKPLPNADTQYLQIPTKSNMNATYSTSASPSCNASQLYRDELQFLSDHVENPEIQSGNDHVFICDEGGKNIMLNGEVMDTSNSNVMETAIISANSSHIDLLSQNNSDIDLLSPNMSPGSHTNITPGSAEFWDLFMPQNTQFNASPVTPNSQVLKNYAANRKQVGSVDFGVNTYKKVGIVPVFNTKPELESTNEIKSSAFYQTNIQNFGVSNLNSDIPLGNLNGQRNESASVNLLDFMLNSDKPSSNFQNQYAAANPNTESPFNAGKMGLGGNINDFHTNSNFSNTNGVELFGIPPTNSGFTGSNSPNFPILNSMADKPNSHSLMDFLYQENNKQ